MNQPPWRGGWTVEHRHGSAQQLHDADAPVGAHRCLRVCHPHQPALVLGSRQQPDEVDAAVLARHGVELARRRSGGGAVLLVPGEVSWIDWWVPPGDPLWTDDVGHAFHWLGEVWCTALAGLGVRATWHRGGLESDQLGRVVCFAGLGPGEVVAAAGPGDARGPKLVGLSQRRTRKGARFQSAALVRWDPVLYVAALPGLGAHPEAALGALEARAAGVGVEAARLTEAVLSLIA